MTEDAIGLPACDLHKYEANGYVERHMGKELPIPYDEQVVDE